MVTVTITIRVLFSYQGGKEYEMRIYVVTGLVRISVFPLYITRLGFRTAPGTPKSKVQKRNVDASFYPSHTNRPSDNITTRLLNIKG